MLTLVIRVRGYKKSDWWKYGTKLNLLVSQQASCISSCHPALTKCHLQTFAVFFIDCRLGQIDTHKYKKQEMSQPIAPA
jgi:hypothetical protein